MAQLRARPPPSTDPPATHPAYLASIHSANFSGLSRVADSMMSWICNGRIIRVCSQTLPRDSSLMKWISSMMTQPSSASKSISKERGTEAEPCVRFLCIKSVLRRISAVIMRTWASGLTLMSPVRRPILICGYFRVKS